MREFKEMWCENEDIDILDMEEEEVARFLRA
jgi:hypothetical protein